MPLRCLCSADEALALLGLYSLCGTVLGLGSASRYGGSRMLTHPMKAGEGVLDRSEQKNDASWSLIGRFGHDGSAGSKTGGQLWVQLDCDHL